VAPTEATVFVLGDSGTGKELVAQTLHQLSERSGGPFLPLNCGAVSPSLIESELFGHERGSFTGANRTHQGHFERASGGTLFLDEITEMPIELQVKLLRVLETGLVTRVGAERQTAVDVRVVAASNRDPRLAVEEGNLREDLFYRLNVFPIQLPRLVERDGDVETLALHFLADLNSAQGTAKSVTRDALQALRGHSWPGNVRELRNVVQRAFILADREITPSSLPADLGRPRSGTGSFEIEIGLPLEEAKRRLILGTVQRSATRKEAASVLGISLKTLYNNLKQYESFESSEDS
jgi:DNA-binding NtrC family response regulator